MLSFKNNQTFTSSNIKRTLTHECISDYNPIIILKALFKYIPVLLKVLSGEQFYERTHALFISCMHINKAVNMLTQRF